MHCTEFTLKTSVRQNSQDSLGNLWNLKRIFISYTYDWLCASVSVVIFFEKKENSFFSLCVISRARLWSVHQNESPWNSAFRQNTPLFVTPSLHHHRKYFFHIFTEKEGQNGTFPRRKLPAPSEGRRSLLFLSSSTENASCPQPFFLTLDDWCLLHFVVDLRALSVLHTLKYHTACRITDQEHK